MVAVPAMAAARKNTDLLGNLEIFENQKVSPCRAGPIRKYLGAGGHFPRSPYGFRIVFLRPLRPLRATQPSPAPSSLELP